MVLVVTLLLLLAGATNAFQYTLRTTRMKQNSLLAWSPTAEKTQIPSASNQPITPKSATKDIMKHFAQPTDKLKDAKFSQWLTDPNTLLHLDGLHMLTIMFQCARTKRRVKSIVSPSIILKRLEEWDREWSERDISTFLYGVQSLDCMDVTDSKILTIGADKILNSSAKLTSRSIGNALYGLRDLTTDSTGAAELCAAMAVKVREFRGDLGGQDIGIGLYGLQGMSASVPQVRQLIGVLAEKIAASEAELDAQAMSNALYGLQSMSSEYSEVRQLVAALSSKVGETSSAGVALCAQSIGSALYGLQKLSSDTPEVRSLVAALAEKVESSSANLDAQAISNALFGLQRMKSNTAEVRALVQALSSKIASAQLKEPLDAQAIGAALYGLHSLSSNSTQVRTLLGVLAERVAAAQCNLGGQGIADALYGLNCMTTDCAELRALLSAVAERIDANKGKLDSQEIGNALYGLQGLSSEMAEVRLIVQKLAEKIRRSSAVLRAQHICRALLGLKRFGSSSPEVRYLLKQLTVRIAASERTVLTGASIADSLFGLQGLDSDVPEVQELLGELAKKIALTQLTLSSQQLGRALFGLQGLRSASSVFAESAIGLASDEVQFLLSALWDKVKLRAGRSEPFHMYLRDVAQGLLGLTQLNDPIANNLRMYLYSQLAFIGSALSTSVDNISANAGTSEASDVADGSPSAQSKSTADFQLYEPVDVVTAVRALNLNSLPVPIWLATAYDTIAQHHTTNPVRVLSRSDRLVTQRFTSQYPSEKVVINCIVDGFRLDMLFPNVKLNVELDGPTHKYAARMLADAQRDDYLQNEGYQVLRLRAADRPAEEVVQEIYAFYKDLQATQAEREIQKLYASKQTQSAK